MNEYIEIQFRRELLTRLETLSLDASTPFYREGRPTADVVGFFVHMGELADGKPTNQLDLRKKLTKTSARRFLY